MGLWKHQQDAVERFLASNSIGLWFEMGTGKTATGITCITERSKQEDIKSLILCPKIVLEEWKKEFKRWANWDKEVLVLSGSGANRIDQLKKAKDVKVVITNHQALTSMPKLTDALMKCNFKLVLVDELHLFKGPTNKGSQALHKLADQAKYRIGLTGTLILNTYEDLWSQLRFLNQSFVGSNFYFWRTKHFFNANANKSWLSFPDYKPTPGSLKTFEKLIDHSGIVVKKSDVLDLPPLVKTVRYVDLHEKIARHYREMEKNFFTPFTSTVDDEEIDDVVKSDLIITKQLRLQQICSGILKGRDGTEVLETCKSEALMETLEAIGCPAKKVIIWCNWIKGIEYLEKICKALNLYTCKIVGGQTTAEREIQKNRFNQEAKYSVMLANQRAGGRGIGLQAASYMIYFSKDYNLESDLQSEARAYRAGSEIHESITRIDFITRGTIEEVIHEALQSKMDLATFKNKLKERYGN